MKIYYRPKGSDNWLVTVAIGNKHLLDWEKNALPTWKVYCEKYSLGLIVFNEELIGKQHIKWKKVNWHKLLIGKKMKDLGYKLAQVLYLDTDILISPLAPNVFDIYDENKIAVVSQIEGLPQPLDKTLRRLAFLRNKNWDKNYPLDSALFMPVAKIFEFHNLKPFTNYLCTGFFIFSVSKHADLLESWFYKYEADIETLTGGGEEPHLNYELQSWGQLQWLPYEFQALWTYEIAWRYPFLFDYGVNKEDLIRECIESSLYSNHFLHFAGSWGESQMWKIGDYFSSKKKMENLDQYSSYLTKPLTGLPKGIIKPV